MLSTAIVISKNTHNECQRKMGESCRSFDFCPHSKKPSASLILTHMDALTAKMRI